MPVLQLEKLRCEEVRSRCLGMSWDATAEYTSRVIYRVEIYVL